MTLILSECVEAIKILDSEVDVIEAACLQVLLDTSDKADGIQELANHIIQVFWTEPYDAGDVMGACAVVAGRLAGGTCLPNKASRLLRGLQGLMARTMSDTIGRRLNEELDEDPSKAIEFLIGLLNERKEHEKRKETKR